MNANYFNRVDQAVRSIREKINSTPPLGIILGSGLGMFTDNVKGLEIPYERIRGFPASCIKGQRGVLKVNNVCMIFSGRFHYYQGYSMQDVVLPIYILHQFGVKKIIITNAAGGIDPSYNPGDLVLIKDHINLMGDNPLRGPWEERQGVRFPDMTYAYTEELRNIAKKISAKPFPEGVYAALSGPNYETPAEIRMLEILGATMVGMSTVPEVIAASALSIDVLGISCIVNKAAGLTEKTLNHEEVIEIGKKSTTTLTSFLFAFCKALGYELV